MQNSKVMVILSFDLINHLVKNLRNQVNVEQKNNFRKLKLLKTKTFAE